METGEATEDTYDKMCDNEIRKSTERTNMMEIQR